MAKDHIKPIAENRKARFDYFIEDKFEAGMVLKGTEVKSLRQGRANLKDSYASIKDGEVWVHQMHVSPYPFAYYGNHDPFRKRKLLLNKHEIKRLIGKTTEKGLALVPLSLYFKGGRIKMKLGLAKGKKSYDKRQSIRERETKRDLNRANRQRDY